MNRFIEFKKQNHIDKNINELKDRLSEISEVDISECKVVHDVYDVVDRIDEIKELLEDLLNHCERYYKDLSETFEYPEYEEATEDYKENYSHVILYAYYLKYMINEYIVSLKADIIKNFYKYQNNKVRRIS